MKKNRFEKVKHGRFTFKECPVVCLWIDIESYCHMIDNHLEYTSRDVSAGRVTNQRVIEETLDMIRGAGNLIGVDISNIERCVEFIQSRYPHALFGAYEETIPVENLTADEMLDCLQQEGLSFGYGRLDKNGEPIIEDEAE